MFKIGTQLVTLDGKPVKGGALHLSHGNIPMDRQHHDIGLDKEGRLMQPLPALTKGQSMRLVDAGGKILWQVTRTK